MPDTLGASLDLFLQITGRISLSPAEYHEAIAAGWELIPVKLLDQFIERAIEKKKPEKRSKTRIGWIVADVAEDYAAWRRAVGT